MSNAASQHYLTQQIMTASPATLVQMLYDKAIGSLKEAIKAIEENEIEARWKANSRAIEIIAHMQGTLDMEKGGEISKNLDRLFGYMLSRLPRVDFRNDAQAAREVIGLLEPLRDSWRDLAAQGDKPQREAARVSAEIAAAPVAKAPVSMAAAQPVAQAAASSRGGYASTARPTARPDGDGKRIVLSA
ncbi:MAG TPA: flagellar export chaperone FliS [Alphaproteobacteria bacterium]|jgi:flagellar protein FliS